MDAKQCRMARTGLGWRALDLSTAAGVATATIARFELGRAISDDSHRKLEKALIDAGAQFHRKPGRVGVTVPE
jgi:transcriptional regulator with XRE-family HTH domain